MRCASGLIVLLIASGMVGCRNQTAPLANPFLHADRVPPPSTQIPPPGAAQPYYGGDVAAGAATTNIPTTAYPPATTYPAAGSYAPPAAPAPAGPASPITPTPAAAPAVGWPAHPTQAQSNPSSAPLFAGTTGESVQVPADGQRLRFEPATESAAPISTATTIAPTLPAGQYTAAVQQAAFNQPATSGDHGYQQLQAREVTPAEFASTRGVAPVSSSPAPVEVGGSDRFRPQSADSLSQGGAAASTAAAMGFRSPSLGNGGTSTGEKNSNERFAVGPAQEWLRGQLEYWPETGEWSIRYMPDGQVDQIGGRILVDNPQVLANLSPGEFVMVEGQVFGRQIDEGYYRPVYRVSAVQRQRL